MMSVFDKNLIVIDTKIKEKVDMVEMMDASKSISDHTMVWRSTTCIYFEKDGNSSDIWQFTIVTIDDEMIARMLHVPKEQNIVCLKICHQEPHGMNSIV